MKKLCCLALAVALLGTLDVPAAAQEVDLAALSWEELVELKAKINLELLTRKEWQEVEVPQGVYVVGEDIPAGKWTVKCFPGQRYCTLHWGDVLKENGHEISYDSTAEDKAWIHDPELGEPGSMFEYTFEAKEGYYIVVGIASAIFTPYTGKPDLGFQ